ncbi:MAG TPA: hypothetical protein VF753_09150 [Terriglobales bacterium]
MSLSIHAATQVLDAQAFDSLPDSPSTVMETNGEIETAKPYQEEAPPDLPCTTKVRPIAPTDDQPNPPYQPLSSHCKFELFIRQTYSPYNLASVAFEATWAQAFAQWPQYGGGMEGWGKRLGATYADTESRRFIQGYVLSTVLHQDPRYFYSGKKNVVARGWYAATRVLITRSDRGTSELNTSELFGALAASSLQDAYYPRPYRTFGNTMGRFSGALSSDATTEIIKEFTPDLMRFYHAHAPARLQKLVVKCPIVGKETQ